MQLAGVRAQENKADETPVPAASHHFPPQLREALDHCHRCCSIQSSSPAPEPQGDQALNTKPRVLEVLE